MGRLILLLFLFAPFCVAFFMEDNHDYYKKLALQHMRQKLDSHFGKKMMQLEAPPKNVILFVGDGMGLTAVKGARVAINQKNNVPDVDEPLFFETFPWSGIVKTACHNLHITDSAAAAVSMLTGWKVTHYTLGRKPGLGEKCEKKGAAAINDGITDHAVAKGISVGVVSTAAVTDAIPAAAYAKDVHRYMAYDDDKDIRGTECTDIARQALMHPANKFKVLFGGGKKFFTPKSVDGGVRTDGKNLMDEFKTEGKNRFVVTNKKELDGHTVEMDQQVLGLFAPKDMSYKVVDDAKNDRTFERSQSDLMDMTKKAIHILERQSNSPGYFLLVEGAMIDKAEHDNRFAFAQEETEEFDKTIKMVSNLVGDDTLMLVTADHSHALAILGMWYKNRSIYEQDMVLTNLPQIFFATGPGKFNPDPETFRFNETEAIDKFFMNPAAKSLGYNTHGGEDVGIWAKGPYAWLFSGTIENTQIAHGIKYLMCLNDDNICDLRKQQNAEGTPIGTPSFSPFTLIMIVLCVHSLLLLYLLKRYNQNPRSRSENLH